MDKVLTVRVRVKLMGVPVGVKAEGGILDQVLREVEIECLPADIPSHIDVDVSELDMHQVIRVSGLPHSDKIKYLNSEDTTVAHVITIREEVVATPEAEAAAVAAGCSGGAGSGEEGQGRSRGGCGQEAGIRRKEVGLGRGERNRGPAAPVAGTVPGGGARESRSGVPVDSA